MGISVDTAELLDLFLETFAFGQSSCPALVH